MLTFRFSTQDGKSLSATARTTVSAPDAKSLFMGTPWELPRENLYLSAQPALSWNELPEDKREIIGLKRVFFTPLLEQPDYDNSWYPIQAWNQMHELLQPRACPPIKFVSAFENPSLYPPKFVAFATWSQDGANFLYQAESGERAWLLVETPANSPLPDLKTILRPTIWAKTNPNSGGQTPLVRSLSLFRALAPDTALQAVNTQLVQIDSSTALTLQLPGPTGPPLLRLPVRARHPVP